MNKYVETAKQIRSADKYPTCTETILMSYSEKLGITEKQARALGVNFGAGMRSGNVCGAITGALMVLGGLGFSDPKTVNEVIRRIKERHNDMINCSDLLKANHEAGGDRKSHCDGMICEAIEIIERIRLESGTGKGI